MTKQQEIREHYGKVALLASRGCSIARGCAQPLQKAWLQAGETVLDLGCGGGGEALEAAHLVGPTGFVYGLDMTAEMLAVARQAAEDAKLNNIEFVEGVIESIPLEDDSVDVIISNCVFNLSDNRAAALAEAHRVLKPGGRLVIADIILLNPTVTAKTQALIAPVLGCVNGVLSQDEYFNLFNLCNYTNLEVDVYQRYTTNRLISKAQKRQATDVLAALQDPTLSKLINGAFASVYLLAQT